MKKQRIQMIAILCVLVLCVGGYFTAKNMPEDEETVVVSENHTVTNVNQDEVIELAYLHEGEIIELIKDNDEWKYKEDKDISLDQTVVGNMLDNVCSIASETLIADADTLEEYGLTNPSNTICITLKDESVIQVLIGDYLDITGDNYILLAGDPNVYTLPSYTVNLFNKSIADLVVEETTDTTEAVE